MIQLLSDERILDKVFEQLVRKETWTNNYMLKEEYAKHIANQKLYYWQDADNIYFFVLKNGFYRLYYFINQPERVFSIVLDKPIVLEILYRGAKHFPTAASDFWMRSGFQSYLTRDAYFLKNKDITLAASLTAVKIQVAKTSEEYVYVKRLMDQDLDLYTGDNLTVEEIQEFAQKGWVFVAYLENKLCGFLQADYKNSICWLGHIVVDQAFRGKGIAKVLVNQYLELGIHIGCTQFQLWVLQDNLLAVNLYKNSGFTYLNKSTYSLLKK